MATTYGPTGTQNTWTQSGINWTTSLEQMRNDRYAIWARDTAEKHEKSSSSLRIITKGPGRKTYARTYPAADWGGWSIPRTFTVTSPTQVFTTGIVYPTTAIASSPAMQKPVKKGECGGSYIHTRHAFYDNKLKRRVVCDGVFS